MKGWTRNLEQCANHITALTEMIQKIQKQQTYSTMTKMRSLTRTTTVKTLTATTKDAKKKADKNKVVTEKGTERSTTMDDQTTNDKENGEVRVQWCRELVSAVKEKKNGKHKVRIEWNEVYVKKERGDPDVAEETPLKTYWNKHRVKGWRLDLTS